MGDVKSFPPVVQRIIDDFEGKTIYFCDATGGTRVNFEPNNVSLCHERVLKERPQEVCQISDISHFSMEKYYEHLYMLLQRLQDTSFACRKCSLCTLREFHFQPLSFVVVGLSYSCNSNCIYCSGHVGGEKEGYNIAPLLDEFMKAGLVSKDVLFDWGGGEPTQHIGFAEAVNFIFSNGYNQRIHTNGIIFSDEAYKALESGLAIMCISVDSGSPDIFSRMKGHENYDTVWENIAKYCRFADNVYVKFNICNYNSNKSEIDAFLRQCQNAGVRNVVISVEINSYQPERNEGPFYFTEKEFQMAHYLHDEALKMGFNVVIAKFGFQVRAEYDNDGNLKLPSVYFDNIDHEALCRGIMVEAFPTVEMLLNNCPSKDVVVFCAGNWGQLAVRALTKASIKCILVDNDKKKDGCEIEGHIVKLADDFLETCDTSKQYHIVIAHENVNGIVAQINHSIINARLYWTTGASYKKYLGGE